MPPKPMQLLAAAPTKDMKEHRPIFMSRTSDIIGSGYDQSLDQSMALVVRKITERCASTQDLMLFVRKYKSSDNNRVNLGEFRHVLIKFGIMLPFTTIDSIFKIYVSDILTLDDVYTDHDNSGSIDFDEFANWIMNSDYKNMAAGPKAKRNKKKIMKVISPEESLREKVKTAIEEYPQTFERLFSRPTIGYMDFMGDLNRMNMRSLTERDVRELYLLLDPNDTSEITLQLFNDWVYKGIKGRPASTLSRQAKRERPLGKKPIPPMTAKPLTQSVCDSKTAHFKSTSFLRPATNSHLPKELQPSVDPQHGSSVTSADRRLKALLSKEFKLLKASIERNANVDRVGYISTDMLYGLITRYCGIFSVADWKLVLLTLKTDEEKKRIDYKHFLAKYDPDVKIALQLEIYQEKLQTTKGMKKTMSIGSFCGYPTPR